MISPLQLLALEAHARATDDAALLERVRIAREQRASKVRDHADRALTDTLEMMRLQGERPCTLVTLDSIRALRPPPALYSETLLDLAEHARTAPSEIRWPWVRELGEAVLQLVADLDHERQRHQVTTSQLEEATDMIPEATRVIAEVRERNLRLTDLVAQATRDLLASVDRERALQRQLDEATVDLALDSACVVITGRSAAEVTAQLDAELADQHDLEATHHARDQRVPDPDPHPFEEP